MNNKRLRRLLAVVLTVVLAALCALSGCGKKEAAISVDSGKWNTNYQYVFVHGLSGWGSYDDRYDKLPYWGMRTGDLMQTLNAAGFDCAAASVDPQGSAWDRACELYAQLTGTKVDYGKAHAEKYIHQRYGEDYTGRALIAKWSAKDKINLIGHSFGGATIRLFSELMTNGSEAERNATDKGDLSPLFAGGKGDWIYSLTTLAAPHNGTSAYNVPHEQVDTLNAKQKLFSKLMGVGMASGDTGYPRASDDYADYDLKIGPAASLNKRIHVFDDIYYFSVPCSCTEKQADGTYYPDEKLCEPTMFNTSALMGRYTGKTKGGYEITKDWLDNDGLVNTISATAPFTDPSRAFDPAKDDLSSVKRGVWQVLPTYKGDHMSIVGGLVYKVPVAAYYADLMTRINNL